LTCSFIERLPKQSERTFIPPQIVSSLKNAPSPLSHTDHGVLSCSDALLHRKNLDRQGKKSIGFADSGMDV
jgi:hypothetical protein